MDRSDFLKMSSLVLAVAGANGFVGGKGRRPFVILRSFWQTVNIGDIAHTSGVLTMLEMLLPQVGVKEMLKSRFPQMEILCCSNLKQAFGECDFLLHGSGPYLVAERHVRDWVQQTGKPYGVFGISLSKMTDDLKKTLNGAEFIFF